MADVTINQLPDLTPSGSTVVPISNGIITGKTTTSSLGVPIGSIIMWSNYNGAGIPSGWALCDGQAGRPDLRNRFVVGSGSSYSIGNTGGSADAIVVSHTHTATDSGHTHTYNAGTGGAGSRYSGRPKLVANDYPSSPSTNTGYANITVNPTGSSGTNANLPPYYAVAYIIKIS